MEEPGEATMKNLRDSILIRLANADREHQREKGASLLLRCLKWVLALVVSCAALDVFLHLGAGARLALIGLLLALATGLLGWCWYIARVRRNRLEHVARLLEQRDAALGSKLINILQLPAQAQDDSVTPLTRDLARCAIDDYGENLRRVPFEKFARTGAVPRELKRAGWAALAFTAVLVISFPVTRVELPRFVDPFGDHPPYSFTRLDIIDPGAGGTNVIYGRSLVVQVKSAGHRPKEVFLTAQPPGEPAKAITLPMFDKGGAGFHQQLENVRGELVVYAHTKDRHSLSKQVRVGVILVPQLDKAFVRIEPPAYTAIPSEEKGYAFKGVQALAGSTVGFRLQSNRPLREGTLELQAGTDAPQRIPLVPTGTNEVSGKFVARDSGRIRLALVDAAGIPSQENWESALTVTHDLPPDVRVADPDKDAFVAMDFKIEARFEASDDYGLRSLRIHRALNGIYSAPKATNFPGIVRIARESVVFDFDRLGVQPGDVISFFAEAIDNAPEAHLARSATIHLTVIGVEDYNNFLRERLDLATMAGKYEELMGRLNDLIEEQKKLGQAAKEAAGKLAKADAKQKDVLQLELDSLLARQSELNQKLNQQADLMQNFVREQPVYDVEKELQADLREFATKIRESTQANDTASKDVAQRSSPAGGGRQVGQRMFSDLKDASDEQVRKLGGVEQQAQQDLLDTLEETAAMQQLLKDFNQFEALTRAQQTLTDQARPYNRSGEMGREDQLALKDLAGTERQVGELLDKLADNLREDAKAAEKNFPKAAKSARALADKIEEARLKQLAGQATAQMLAARGEASFQSADRLRAEMEKMFGECNGEGNCPGSDELDQYLRLTRSKKPGNTFAQMKKSRNFARPGGKRGGGQGGEGEGMDGESGYAVTDQQAMNVLGNESMISRSSRSDRASAKAGLGQGSPSGADANTALDKADAIKGLNPVNRNSGAVKSESLLEEYSDVVEKYFKAITK